MTGERKDYDKELVRGANNDDFRGVCLYEWLQSNEPEQNKSEGGNCRSSDIIIDIANLSERIRADRTQNREIGTLNCIFDKVNHKLTVLTYSLL